MRLGDSFVLERNKICTRLNRWTDRSLTQKSVENCQDRQRIPVAVEHTSTGDAASIRSYSGLPPEETLPSIVYGVHNNAINLIKKLPLAFRRFRERTNLPGILRRAPVI